MSLSRRAILALTLSLSLAPAALAAPKDSLTIGMQQEPSSLDPTADATASIATIMNGNVYETLLTIDRDGGIAPGVAKSWTVSDDGLTYTFKLEPGHRFSDGTQVDANMVKFSFDRSIQANSTNPRRSDVKFIDSVEAPDLETVVFHLKEPDGFLLFTLTQAPFIIVAPGSADTNATQPVGSGPYKLKQWVRGDRLVLALDDSNPQAQKAKLREVTYKFVPAPAAAAAGLLAGDLDAYPGFPSPESLVQFENDPRFDVSVGTTEGEVVLVLNNGKKPFDDLRVRRAINHLIDRQAVVEGAMFGYGTPIGSFFPPTHPAYVDLTGRYPHDVAAAKALLAEAGYPDGFEVKLEVPPFPYARRSGEIIAQQLADGGIKVDYKVVEWPYWIGEIYKNGQYDMTIVAFTSANDIGNFARGPSYFYHYDNPDFDALYTKIRQEGDLQKQYDLLREAQKMIAEEAVHGFLFQLPQLGIWPKDLAGYWTSSPGNANAPLKDLYWKQ